MARFQIQLDLQLFAQEKTESATPKKRQDARKKGQVAKSMELPAALILLLSFGALYAIGSFMKSRMLHVFSSVFSDYMLWDLSLENVQILFNSLMMQGLIILGPIFAISVIVAVLANYFQFGLLFTTETLQMKFSKINPIEGFKRIFSMHTLVDFLKTMLKLIIIGYLVYSTLWKERGHILELARLPVEQIFVYAGSITMSLGLKIAVCLVVLAVFDYLYQKYEYEKNLRMSKQDIKDEYKKSEGDPLIKGKIKHKQREMAMRRMMQEVPKADVIITNPTHFAVAIQYDSAKMQAPTVIAKGADYTALRIKEIAKEHGIITMENKPLARALYGQVEIGEAIPADMFQAVAEVLAYVYKLKGKVI